MPLKPDSTMKGYTVVTHLGSGGMAEVYRARQLSLDRPVAIKEMKASFAEDPAIVEQFEQEARSLASLRHENITYVLDYWQRRTKRYIVMELVKGVSVDDLLDRAGPLPWYLAAEIVRQTALALHYAHERGLVHLDVKPANLMVTYEGKVKLMDFGISRLAGGTKSALEDLVLGSPGFMAPEQIGGEPSPASDQYALGVTFYGLLCNELPYDGDDIDEVHERMQRGKYVKPRKINRALPRKGQGIARRMMRQRPIWRYRNLERVAQVLDDLLTRQGKADGEGLLMEFLHEQGWIPAEASEGGLLDSDTTVVQKRIRRRRLLRLRRRAVRAMTVIAVLTALSVGGEATVRWNYARKHPAPAAQVRLEVSPAVWVSVDGVPYSLLPQTAGAVINAPPGKHTLTLANPLYLSREEPIAATEKKRLRVEVMLESRLAKGYTWLREYVAVWLVKLGTALGG